MSLPFDQSRVRLEESLRGGMSWSLVIRRGNALRITAAGDNAGVALLAFNASQPLDRYNMPDTLKCQHTFCLRKGNILYSDMGHALLSVIDDTVGWHDAVCGVSNRALVREKHGEGSYQQKHNDWIRNGRDLLLVELGKHGLGRRDLVAPVNLFSKVVIDDGGNMQFVAGNSRCGDYVDLRAEMDVLVVLAVIAHPLDPVPVYAPVPVDVTVWECGVATADDLCRNSRPENVRGLQNTARCYCQHSHAEVMP